MGTRETIQKKLQQLTGGNVSLNKKALKIKYSLDEINKILNSFEKKDRKKKADETKQT
ncbi:MAG: hypothetical protein Q4D90_02915 [bacterium]|nr:hypothetical protein [bacterium]